MKKQKQDIFCVRRSYNSIPGGGGGGFPSPFCRSTKRGEEEEEKRKTVTSRTFFFFISVRSSGVGSPERGFKKLCNVISC